VPRFRKMIDVSIPLIGTVIVFLGVVMIPDFNLQLRIMAVLGGVLLI